MDFNYSGQSRIIMAQITPNLALTVWNNTADPYNSAQLADNFVKIDQHDHSGGVKGIRIDGSTSILANSIGSNAIGSNAVTANELSSSSTSDDARAVGTNHIKVNSIDSTKIVNGTITRSDLKSTINDNATPVVLASTDSLPTGASIGDEIYYNYSTNVCWHLRYNGSSWNFIGGPALVTVYTTTSGDILNGSNTAPTSPNGTTLTVPFAGIYNVWYSGTGQFSVSGGQGSLAVGLYSGTGTTPIPGSGIYAAAKDTDLATASSGVIQATVLSTSKILKLGLWRPSGPSSGNLNFRTQIISAIPISITG
jgi:hypothetical protein